MSNRDRDSTNRRGTSRRRSSSITKSRSRSPRIGGAGGQFRGRAEDNEGNPHFSNYYRDRFGSESPQEYQNLRVTNVDGKVSNDELRDILIKYLGRFGEMNVKVIRQGEPHERIAYVNFERVGDARSARHGCLQKLVELLGRRITVDPAGVTRDQGGRCVKTTSSGGRSPPYPSSGDNYDIRDNSSYRFGGYDRDRSYNRDNRYNDYDRGDYYGSDYRNSGSSSRDRRDTRPQYGDGPRRRPNDYVPSSGGRRDLLSPKSHDESDEEANATRILFIGNLTLDISKSDLQKAFNKFGVIEQIDIKTPHDGSSCYAFVRFQNMAMAQEAKRRMTGNCGSWKIGYAKTVQTRRLWVGGLGPNTSLAWLEKEFDRFGAIEKIDYVRGENYAYILFGSEEAAAEGWKKMRGMQVRDGSEKRSLQVDFADSSMYDGKDQGQQNYTRDAPDHDVRTKDSGHGGNGKTNSLPRRRNASPSSSKRPSSPKEKQKDNGKSKAGPANSSRRSPHTPPPPPKVSSFSGSPTLPKASAGAMISDGTVSSTTTSPPTSLCELTVQTLDELHQVRSPCWTGALVLKKSAYPIRLYKLAGDDDLIDSYLRNERGESVQLSITQRLKLDQPKQEDVQKWISSPSDQHAFMLAAANTNALATQGNLADLQPRPLKLLVKYFKDKDAAGVVSVVSNRRMGQESTSSQQPQNGILYTFPRCSFSDLLTSALCPKLGVMQKCSDECLLVVLQRSQT